MTTTIEHLQAAGPLRTIWATAAGKGSDDDSLLTASPIVADGLVYVLDAEGHVFAFNAVIQDNFNFICSEHFANPCCFLQCFAANKLFKNRFAYKTMNRQTCLHQKGC